MNQIADSTNQEFFFASIPSRIKELFSGKDWAEPWHIFSQLEEYIREHMSPGNHGVLWGDARIEDNVEIGEGTIIEQGAVIKGPTIIGKNCEIRSGAYIRGGVITGDSCVIGHATEVIRSIFFDYVRLDHLNYVGDSLLGNRVHFGAGAKVANVRFDEKEIVVNGKKTGLKKFGAVMGDRSQVGVNTTVGPGIIFEHNTWLTVPHQLPSGIYTRKSLQRISRLVH